MKKCPTCEKTFDDNLRFCQSDGTPLVEVVETAEPEDPYKTVVARNEDIASAIPPEDPFKTVVGGSQKKDESGDLLQLPKELDPLRTMYVSEKELRKEMDAGAPKPFEEQKEDVIDLPPIAPPFGEFPSSGESRKEADQQSAPPPELPKFSEPDLSPPSFGESSTPFSGGGGLEDRTMQIPSESLKKSSDESSKTFESYKDSPFNKPTGPIPSPFDKGKPTSFDPPVTPLPTYEKAPELEPEPKFEEPKFEEPASPFGAPPPSPFGMSSEPEVKQPLEKAQTEWTPPPAPEAGWQNQEIGQNTPFQPPPAGAAGENKTLAIVSLVLGVLSIMCCAWFLPGIAAVVLGFMAKSKAEKDPAHFGGRGLALGGIITGGISVVLGIIVTILYLMGTFASMNF